jgi:hypothetical protein
MNDETTVPTVVPPKRWSWYVLAAFPLLVILVGVGIFVYYDQQAGRAVREAMAETDRQEPQGWQFDAIKSEYDASVPADEDNVALTLSAIDKTIRLIPPHILGSEFDASWQLKAPDKTFAMDVPLEERIDLPPVVQLDAALIADLREYLAKLEHPLECADQLADQTKGHFELSIYEKHATLECSAGFPRDIVTLLREQALLRTQDGDSEGALRSARALLNVGRAHRNLPALRRLWIRATIELTAVRSIERTLAHGIASDSTLQAIQRLMQEGLSDPDLLSSLRGERAVHHLKFQWILSGGSILGAYGEPGSDSTRARVESVGDSSRAKRAYPQSLRLANEYVRAAELPAQAQKAEFQRLDAKNAQLFASGNMLVGLLPTSVYNDGLRSTRGREAIISAALAALAAERFRLRQGRWPRSLAELKEQAYLSSEICDPWDGMPLRLKPLADGLIIYSVGSDETDDGGKIDREQGLLAPDIGFQLWNPEHRRQRAAELLPKPTPIMPTKAEAAKLGDQ